MPVIPHDLGIKIILAWFAYCLDPEPQFQLAPTDPAIVCRKCWRPKPLEQFYRHTSNSGRILHGHTCKACHKLLFGLPQEANRKAAAAARRAERQQRPKKCRRCAKSHPLATWAHYPAGNLHKFCPKCDAELEAQHTANDVAKARGYRDVSHTPEYHRLQREWDAERLGRTLDAYIPQGEKERRAAWRRSESIAERHRKKLFRLLLREYDWIAGQNREITDSDREYFAACQRKYYARHRQQEVARHLAWKASNPDKARKHDQIRRDRIAATDDCTATPAVIAQMKRAATHCAYCGSRLLIKQTDHMLPVCLGGEHSVRNIVIVCPDCNGKKHKLSYQKWIERVEPQHRARVVALWLERFGEAAA